jgi:hypothetical protein
MGKFTDYHSNKTASNPNHLCGKQISEQRKQKKLSETQCNSVQISATLWLETTNP